MTLGDRIVIMKDGYIQQIGTPQEVFDHPANLFVSGFIGMPQMNYFSAKLVKEDDRYAVSVEGCKVVLSAEKQKNLAAHKVAAQNITLGVRPSHMVLAKEPGNTLSAVIDVSELMGSEIHFHANANDDHRVRPLEQDRVPDDGLVDIADVAGEDDALLHAVFL